MAEGVRGSCFVFLFLSEGVLTRPFVQFEVDEALQSKTPIILMHEADPRHQPFNFGTARA